MHKKGRKTGFQNLITEMLHQIFLQTTKRRKQWCSVNALTEKQGHKRSTMKKHKSAHTYNLSASIVQQANRFGTEENAWLTPALKYIKQITTWSTSAQTEQKENTCKDFELKTPMLQTTLPQSAYFLQLASWVTISMLFLCIMTSKKCTTNSHYKLIQLIQVAVPSRIKLKGP